MDLGAVWEIIVQLCSSILRWTDEHAGAAGWFQGIGTIVAVYMAAKIATKQTIHSAKQARLDRLESAKAYFDGFTAIALEAFAPFARLEDILKKQDTIDPRDLKHCLEVASRGMTQVSGFPIHGIPGFKINRAAISIGTRLHSLRFAVETIEMVIAIDDVSLTAKARDSFTTQLDGFEDDLNKLNTAWSDHMTRENAQLG